jgi:hypothetical protein
MAETSLLNVQSMIFPVSWLRLLNLEASLTDQFGGSARCKKTDIIIDQALSKIKQACLVINRKNC